MGPVGVRANLAQQIACQRLVHDDEGNVFGLIRRGAG
jgi:hypothetical protein